MKNLPTGINHQVAGGREWACQNIEHADKGIACLELSLAPHLFRPQSIQRIPTSSIDTWRMLRADAGVTC